MAIIFKHRLGETRTVVRHDDDGELYPDEVPAHTQEVEGREVETCSVCGEPYAAAYWRGRQMISVCRDCALNILPALIADALVGEFGDNMAVITNLYHAVEVMAGRFWKAAAVAIHRANLVRRKHDEMEAERAKARKAAS